MSEKQFSNVVIEYQNQVESIIAWLFSKEEELQKRPDHANFNDILEEYSRHEKFLSLISEYCHTVIKCKEEGQELRDNDISLTEEDRDEIGIQIDAMSVCYEKLKILTLDRLHDLQRIIDERQRSKIERLDEWLTSIELKIASSNNIGPDYNSIQRQIQEMKALDVELKQKQDFLNITSQVIIFDEIDSESLQIRSRSNESLDERLEKMDRRWTEICRYVDDRNERLRKAESIWKLLNLESPQLAAWLKRIESSLNELSEATRSVTDTQAEKPFIGKLLSRSEKIDSEIKSKQSFYSSLENSVRNEIEKFDDPCSMLVIELEKKLEDMQDNWNTIMNRKRMLDYSLQALTNPQSSNQVHCSMIPLPDPITSNSNNDLRFNSTNEETFRIRQISQRDHVTEPNQISSSSGNDDKSSLHINGSLSDPKAFDNSLSSETRSLLYGNNQDREQGAFITDSQDELSSNPLNAISNDHDDLSLYQDTSHNQADLLNSEKLSDIQCDLTEEPELDGSHSCRVEEWKHSLESFSTWLKKVEFSLGLSSSHDAIDSKKSWQNWIQLDRIQQLTLLNDIERQIFSTCQDEFDCLLLQGQQIIEDLMPEIGENEYEANLKSILADIELRYGDVKKCIARRKEELADREKLQHLSRTLRESSAQLIDKMGQVVPETNIGIDLITLAQQQEQLLHAKDQLIDNTDLQSTIREAKTFIKMCDILQQQYNQSQMLNSINNQQHSKFTDPSIKSSNFDIWMSFKDFKEDIEDQLDRLTLHYSELSQLIDDRLERLDEVHKEMHALQHKIQDLATKLQVAEILKSHWVPLENLTVEQLSEQLEDLKLYRERLSEIESIHKMMNSIFEWMTQSDVPLSQSNLKRISELNTIWSLVQVSVEERQKLIEQAFDDQTANEQRFLSQTVADLPRWERRVATSKVPYFIDHDSNKTQWDHPKFTNLLNEMSATKQYFFSVYRVALKLRMVQRKLGIEMLMLEQLKEILDSPELVLEQECKSAATQSSHSSNNNDILIGVEQIILYLKAIYEKLQVEELSTLDVPLSIDLTLNWLLNLYDSTRTGYISRLSLKVGLSLICCATREEKYIYMYELVANPATGTADARRLGMLFEASMRIPIYLGEGESFGGSELIESSVRNCFSKAKFNPQHSNCIDLADYLNWLKSEPQLIIWLPVLHRLLISENTTHHVRCKLCGTNPIVGLRYRCLKCLKFNICQNCFLTGRHIYEHYDPAKHPMQEYCYKTSSGENVRDLTRILKNKLNPKSSIK